MSKETWLPGLDQVRQVVTTPLPSTHYALLFDNKDPALSRCLVCLLALQLCIRQLALLRCPQTPPPLPPPPTRTPAPSPQLVRIGVHMDSIPVFYRGGHIIARRCGLALLRFEAGG